MEKSNWTNFGIWIVMCLFAPRVGKATRCHLFDMKIQPVHELNYTFWTNITQRKPARIHLQDLFQMPTIEGLSESNNWKSNEYGNIISENRTIQENVRPQGTYWLNPVALEQQCLCIRSLSMVVPSLRYRNLFKNVTYRRKPQSDLRHLLHWQETSESLLRENNLNFYSGVMTVYKFLLIKLLRQHLVVRVLCENSNVNDLVGSTDLPMNTLKECVRRPFHETVCISCVFSGYQQIFEPVQRTFVIQELDDTLDYFWSRKTTNLNNLMSNFQWAASENYWPLKETRPRFAENTKWIKATVRHPQRAYRDGEIKWQQGEVPILTSFPSMLRGHGPCHNRTQKGKCVNVFVGSKAKIALRSHVKYDPTHNKSVFANMHDGALIGRPIQNSVNEPVDRVDTFLILPPGYTGITLKQHFDNMTNRVLSEIQQKLDQLTEPITEFGRIIERQRGRNVSNTQKYTYIQSMIKYEERHYDIKTLNDYFLQHAALTILRNMTRHDEEWFDSHTAYEAMFENGALVVTPVGYWTINTDLSTTQEVVTNMNLNSPTFGNMGNRGTSTTSITLQSNVTSMILGRIQESPRPTSGNEIEHKTSDKMEISGSDTGSTTILELITDDRSHVKSETAMTIRQRLNNLLRYEQNFTRKNHKASPVNFKKWITLLVTTEPGIIAIVVGSLLLIGIIVGYINYFCLKRQVKRRIAKRNRNHWITMRPTNVPSEENDDPWYE